MTISNSDLAYLKTLSVLYVEDDVDTRTGIARLLLPRIGSLITADNGAEGLAAFRDHSPDIVITDIHMPVMDGLSMAQEIRHLNQQVPIIIITAFEQTDYLMHSIEIGIDRYVIKPVMLDKLMAALHYCSRQLFAEQRISHLALHDALTDLPNRTLLKERLEMACAAADRNSEQLAMLFIDLDRFKEINDTLGHTVGDYVLQEVAKRLKELFRSVDTVCRLGGDEFLVVITGVSSHDSIAAIARKMVGTLNEEMLVDGHALKVTPSVGIAIYPEHGTDMVTLIRSSDSAMYRSKQQGGNCFSFCNYRG